MKKIIKMLIGICILSLIIGTASAEIVDEFKAPSPLNPFGTSSFADGQGHNIQICEDTEDFHKIWFENNTETSYLVEPYQGNDSFYLYVDGAESDPNSAEALGIIEIVENNGNKYIVNSWTANDNDNDFKIAYENLLEFNEINQLTPISI